MKRVYDAGLKRLASDLLEEDLGFSSAAMMPRLSVATHRVESYLDNLKSGGSNPNNDNDPIKVLSPILIELAQLLDGQSNMLSANAERGVAVEQVRKGDGAEMNTALGALRVDINMLRTLVGNGLDITNLQSVTICDTLRNVYDELEESGVLKLGVHTGEALGKLEVAPVLERFSHAINDLSG